MATDYKEEARALVFEWLREHASLAVQMQSAEGIVEYDQERADFR